MRGAGRADAGGGGGDTKKAAQNIAKHGIPFEYAARVFTDTHRLDSEDTRRDYREERRIAMGEIEDGFL